MTSSRSDVDEEPSSTPTALAIVNARVWTGDPRRPWADAVFLRAGRIEAVGSSAEVRKRAGAATKVIDAKGLVIQHPRQSGVLAPGASADLILVARPLGDVGRGAPSDAEIVLAIESGRIVTDRDALGTSR
jgi:predicted amidohydrolase YtcJ